MPNETYKLFEGSPNVRARLEELLNNLSIHKDQLEARVIDINRRIERAQKAVELVNKNPEIGDLLFSLLFSAPFEERSNNWRRE